MNNTALDPCFFYKKDRRKLVGVQVVQAKDTWERGAEEFAILDAEKSKQFECKPRVASFPLKLNGIWIESSKNGGYSILQKDYCQSITFTELSKTRRSVTFIKDPTLQKEFLFVRGQLSYVCTSTRPDLSFYLAALSQVPKERLKMNTSHCCVRL